MTKEQKDEIIKLCKEHIDDQGSVRVGWAVEEILKSKQQNHILDKVSATILESNEYIKESANPNFTYDWNIRKNPTYKKLKWHERNPIRYDFLKMLGTAVFSIITSAIIANYITTNKVLQLTEEQKEMVKEEALSKTKVLDSIIIKK